MKNYFVTQSPSHPVTCLFSKLAAIAACFLLMFTCACDKDNDNNNNQGKMWDPGWLIGTWEGTTPSSIMPFGNTKIRVVFENYNLEAFDTVPGNIRKLFAYSGTFTWDVDDTAWSMGFIHANYPTPGYDVIIWDCLTYTAASQTMNNVSLRIGDTIQTNPWHSMDLDWGPFADGTGNPPAYLDFYGDIEIEINGTLLRADYAPQEGKMIRLTKK
jgi:hypothetical protein